MNSFFLVETEANVCYVGGCEGMDRHDLDPFCTTFIFVYVSSLMTHRYELKQGENSSEAIMLSQCTESFASISQMYM